MEPFTSAHRRSAKNILAGVVPSEEEAEKLVNELKQERAFGQARRILALTRTRKIVDNELRIRLAQLHALCTYKDPDLPPESKLDHALAILTHDCSLDTTTDQETLGLAGAIHKEMWKLDAQKDHLVHALGYYLRGYRQGPARDNGYTGINAAFIFDLLAQVSTSDETVRQIAETHRNEARAIRQDVVKTLLELLSNPQNEQLTSNWWVLTTLAEAYFGLGEYRDASEWLKKAAGLSNIPDWERESTSRQLVWMAQLHDAQKNVGSVGARSSAWAALEEFLGHDIAAVRSAFMGKVGFALSGGGFRASLFHIGVLAKLAERDVLRHVEVLSCVSGGSIVGTYYYLEVKKLIQEKSDASITRNDYIAIIERIEKNFLVSVQRNLRTRVAASLFTNVKMLFLSNYSRTCRLGDLYEKEIYSKVQDGKGETPRWLSDLHIHPKDEVSLFSPKDHNWRRNAKVPILILNATSLNTGHSWQFTASYMGEPPSSVDAEIDGNYRLRRMYYGDAPADFKKIRLGHAVAASSCVPGLFEPYAMPGLYPGKIVRLVDGGVHDNQGVAGLLEQGCSVVLVSDASGQMEAQDDPTTGLLGVPLRSNSILQARVRVSQYHELCARKRASLLKRFMFVHLKKDLDVLPIDWASCPDPSENTRITPLTPYGLNASIQKHLASIRTDLDSFSETEACALMVSGYRMADRYFDESMPQWEISRRRWPWIFLRIEAELEKTEPSHCLIAQLEIAKYIPLKIWRISRSLQLLAWLLLLLIMGSLAVYSDRWWVLTIMTWSGGGIAALILGLLATRSILPGAGRFFGYRKTLQDIMLGLGMTTVGWLIAGIHLHVFDRLFLLNGRISRHLKRKEAGGVAVFTGHLVDLEDRPTPRFPTEKVEWVRIQIARLLEKLDIRHGFSSAARGGDLLFIEELLKRGGTVSITLPFQPEVFEKSSVGQGWTDRFWKVLKNPRVTVKEPVEQMPTGGDEVAAFKRCNRLIQEAATQFASLLGQRPILLSVWDGIEVNTPGGTSEFIAEWKKTGCDHECINI